VRPGRARDQEGRGRSYSEIPRRSARTVSPQAATILFESQKIFIGCIRFLLYRPMSPTQLEEVRMASRSRGERRPYTREVHRIYLDENQARSAKKITTARLRSRL
jgi:hypothetical protein